MFSLLRGLTALVLGVLCAGGAAGASLDAYDAVYRVQLRKLHVGEALFSLRYDSQADRYIFESRSRSRGIAKLAQPNPVVERSEFLLRDDDIVPLTYSYDDGTRNGKRSTRVVFDWSNGIASSSYKGIDADINVSEGMLDRMTLQTVVMRDMGRPAGPSEYALVHRNALKRYRYELLGTETLDTTLGSLLTKTYLQTREGSSRQLKVWVAPSLRYMPVRMEQTRKGKLQTVMTLTDLTFHDRAGAADPAASEP